MDKGTIYIFSNIYYKLLLVVSEIDDQIRVMAGDVNLFLNDYDDKHNAEIEVMIAEHIYRRQGYAKESLCLMMRYAIDNLSITRFYAKINEANKPSIELFESLGFTNINYVAAFQEYEYQLIVNDSSNSADIARTINSHCTHSRYCSYSNESDSDDIVCNDC